MDNILNDTEKIDFFAQIQNSLCELPINSPSDKIDNLINQIPPNYLNQKDDLMMICQLFSYYSRNTFKNNKGNTIKLFEKILQPIKNLLHDESVFFWEIFGGLFYFKRWMYDEGLISIETIIQSARNDENSIIANYFLPEIIEKEPEIFEKELKYRITTPYTDEYLSEFKELRKKHFKWLRESNDYHDPFYREIEKDQLRYSIKTDDIETFQSILSKSNLSINSTICESLLESFYLYLKEVPLIDFAIEFNAINIFKYLIMNDADVKINPFSSIRNRNYEIIHIIESKVKEKFGEESLDCSIECWNSEMIEYSLNNYNYDFLFESEVNSENDETILSLIDGVFFSFNFIFLQSILLPFLRKNSRFVSENINKIVFESFQDKSCFFAKEFLKFPGVSINYHSTDDIKASFLVKAIRDKNIKAVELLLSYPDININSPGFGDFSPFQFTCLVYSDIKIIDMLYNHPKFENSFYNMNAFQLCIKQGNSYALSYLFDHFKDFNLGNFNNFFFYSIKKHYLFTLKILLKYFLSRNKGKSSDKIVKNFVEQTDYLLDFSQDIVDVFKAAVLETINDV